MMSSLLLTFRSKSDFEILKTLRNGNFGSTFHVRRCSPTDNTSEYLLKQVNLTRIESETPSNVPELAASLIDLCRNEYEKMKQKFDHPNIIRAFGSFEETIGNDYFYFVALEYCDGGDLGQVIQEAREPLLEAQILSWTRQLVSALSFIHETGSFHGDVRPRNVFLVSNRKIVKLGDFGLTRRLESVTKNITKMAVATWPYASPELCSGEPYTQKCDIWSLGILIYELANLKRPFPGEGPSVIVAIVSRPPASFVACGGDYSTDLRNFVFAMLEKEAAKRPKLDALTANYTFLTFSDFEDLRCSISSNSSQFTQRFSDDTKANSQAEEEDGSPSLLVKSLQLDMVRDSTAISQSAKETICAILESELISAEELADLTEQEVDQLFPTADFRYAFYQWRQDFETKKPQRLLAAAERGHVDVLRKMLATDEGQGLLTSSEIWAKLPDNFRHQTTIISPLPQEPTGDRPLHRAARFGKLQIVQILVEEFHAPIEELNERGGTPLGIASQEGHIDVARYFLDRDPKLIEAKNRYGRTPFLSAVATPGNVSMLEILMSRGADIDAKSNDLDLENLAIHIAAELSNVEVVSFLLGLNQNWLEAKNAFNDTPLNRAALAGNVEVVRFLVDEKKANVDNRGFQGWTPLMNAAANGHFEIVDFLLENGADIEARDVVRQNSSAHLAAYFGHKNVLAYLLSYKPALLNVTNFEGHTPIFYAKQKNKSEVIEFLESNAAKDDCFY